ncbi:sensor histidine kinase [Conyzicola sp.]|uniref:sensor histidine kinase n=1 Tax=Conyzicola sp. TaxID=1969404 RepID=UPI003988DBB8
MSLVFPNALAAKTTSLALARGSFWFGIVCLSAVAISLVAIQADSSGAAAWPAVGALLVLAGLGVLVASEAGTHAVIVGAAAVVACVTIAGYAAIVLPGLRSFDTSDAIFLSLPKIAIVVFGMVVARQFTGVASVVVAFFLAEVPVVAVSLAVGHGYAFDVPAFSCFAALVLIITLLKVSRVRTRASEPELSRGSRDDRVAAELARAEHVSSAMVHDTILNELAVVGTVAPGTLSDAAKGQILRSLAVRRRGVMRNADVTADVLGGDLAAAVEHARALGLEVSVAGEVGALDSLNPRTSVALSLAVQQCLANVAAHARTGSAELTVVATDREVCVMVIDSGVGFTESETHPDRLGLRQSVRGRIDAVGGSVQVWTSPGAGTAVSMLVPRA